MSLFVQNVEIGRRVRKIKGRGAGKEGFVKAVDIGRNEIAVRFDGDKKNTCFCDPEEFILLGPVPGTISRGDFIP